MVSSVCLPCAVQLMELQGDMTGVSLQEVTWCQEHVVHCSSGFFFIIIIVFLLWKAIKTFSLPLWRNNTKVTVQTVHDDSIFYLVLLTNTHIPSCIFCKCSSLVFFPLIQVVWVFLITTQSYCSITTLPNHGWRTCNHLSQDVWIREGGAALPQLSWMLFVILFCHVLLVLHTFREWESIKFTLFFSDHVQGVAETQLVLTLSHKEGLWVPDLVIGCPYWQPWWMAKYVARHCG